MQGGMNFEVRSTIPGGLGAPARLSRGGGGTIGCLLKDKHDASAVYALTNQHCLVLKEIPRLSRSRPAVQAGVVRSRRGGPSACAGTRQSLAGGREAAIARLL
jgi:hypothetical protein